MTYEFLQAYIATALWSSTDESDDSGGEPMDSNYGPEDIAPETVADMKADCAAFLAAKMPDGATVAETIERLAGGGKVRCGPDFDEIGHAGHDFWLTRNGHGAGFWDGDWPEPEANSLTAIAEDFRDYDLYLGDDGRIYGA